MECNLELGLQPSSSSSTYKQGGCNGENGSQQQQMTIFYNGNICVCDVTDFQARSIIHLASTKGEGMCTSPTSTGGGACGRSGGGGGGRAKTISPTSSFQTRQMNTQNGLSMKKSLRQFLEKRKYRVQATSPYHH
ncbi:unnamed protein product [Amaranthus hypochondriacus]